MFGSTKTLTKVVSAKFSICQSVGALRYSRIFVNHKCQSHRNKHHRFARCSWERLHEISRVMGSLYVTVIFTASIECVASAYYLACEYSRLSYAPFLRFARMRVGCIRRLHNYCLCCFFFFLEFVQLQQKQLLLLLCQWRLHLYRLQRFGTRNNNFSGLRTEILRLKIEMKFS